MVGLMRRSVGIVSGIVIAHLMVATISLTCSDLVVVVIVVVIVGVDVVGRECVCGEGAGTVPLLTLTNAAAAAARVHTLKDIKAQIAVVASPASEADDGSGNDNYQGSSTSYRADNDGKFG